MQNKKFTFCGHGHFVVSPIDNSEIKLIANSLLLFMSFSRKKKRFCPLTFNIRFSKIQKSANTIFREIV